MCLHQENFYNHISCEDIRHAHHYFIIKP
ncbi:hypothetical protein AAHA92_24639 [Salvia divinorum]|uniref:Uncharacterized protein n=1 Tax=Salvia divinorum TaxID=28513 RepID=A0ABD1G814_SALDI